MRGAGKAHAEYVAVVLAAGRADLGRADFKEDPLREFGTLGFIVSLPYWCGG